MLLFEDSLVILDRRYQSGIKCPLCERHAGALGDAAVRERLFAAARSTPFHKRVLPALAVLSALGKASSREAIAALYSILGACLQVQSPATDPAALMYNTAQ